MKTLKYSIIFILCIGVVGSCNTDELEQVNPNQLSLETFLVTPSQVQAAVNAAYANMQTRGLYSRHMFFAMDNMGHDNDHANNPQLEADKLQYLRFTFDATHGAIRAFWESCYKGIAKTNYVLNNKEKINAVEGLAEADRDRIYGEAMFLRAFYYFLIVTRFGDAPLITTIPEGGDGFGKSPKASIYEQISADLNAAALVLPTEEDGTYEPGRATKGAAYALLGKALLYQGTDYTAAKNAFEKVYGKYALVDNYEENFQEETEHNSESIFEVEYDETLGTSAQWNSDANGVGLNESTFRGQEYGFNDWFNVYPSSDLVSEYEDGDVRKAQTFYFNGDTFSGGTVSLPSYDNTDDGIENPVQRPQAWRKYQNYYKRANEQTNSSINFRVIRYADVLLMMAEVENELGNIGPAVDYMNEVRERAGMPYYGTTEMNDAGYPVSTKEEVFNALVHERRVELAGEQARFPDLVRWGLAEQELGQFGFSSNKNEVFPIPQAEINSNNALTNADQNQGY
ncbi:RagB/SusD family nutrient uptake outer membrane protein [Fulvivirga ligni]|uniref:RagB/SusD family nutrient uptake outer membrane protein n=1 Tax=Fulvivirga ligni TaxID=2904246 RepID=UPI001F239F3D|nr:RagB/SusD family nutrient uptake outer membrane protein [Fulvivirga ligni]UII19900.1 RagB/SusD family nutrient uptake outer membrane protein [Fulvivirga ligni]